MSRFIGWIPIGISPPSWEGKLALWRDNCDAPVQIREIPARFSRSARHCGEIEVAGIDGGNPISDIPDALNAARAEIAALTEQRDRAMKALRLIVELSDKTLIMASDDPHERQAYSLGAHRAFAQCGDIAKTALGAESLVGGIIA